MNSPDQTDWAIANQRILVTEFAALRRKLGEETSASGSACLDAGLPIPSAIDHVAATFDLSPFERSVLLLAAGVEMDAGLAVLVPRLTFGTALAVLDDTHWSALSPLAPLRAWRLVEVEAGSLTQARIRIDERVLHYLAGVNQLDGRLAPLVRRHLPPALMDAHHGNEVERLAGAIDAATADRRMIALAGDDAEGQLDVAAAVASRFGLALCVIAYADIPPALSEQEALARLSQREALLLPSALLIEAGDGGSISHLQHFVERLAGLVFIAAREASLEAPFNARIDKPGPNGQSTLWLQALGDAADRRLREATDAVASQFRLSAGQIVRRAAVLRNVDASAAGERLWLECREQARPRLEDLAQRIEPAAGWDDLVLPEAQLALLHDLAAQVRQRHRVYSDWGFEAKGRRGLGISALFFGESGVGKTMACEVLALELRLDLYRIDLSAVVSKYIGETEKNLRRVFDAAEDSGAVLLFDEADALFGKRSEVKDSHDRYANIEVGYLLQRMEAYRGLAVLTTNQRSALDPAFIRRLRFVIHFPFPDEAQREAIWRGVLPAGLPRADLDFGKLARLQMAGGLIRNIALNGAFLAAEEGEAMRMAHLARAARHEAAKHERSLPEALLRGWD